MKTIFAVPTFNKGKGADIFLTFNDLKDAVKYCLDSDVYSFFECESLDCEEPLACIFIEMKNGEHFITRVSWDEKGKMFASRLCSDNTKKIYLVASSANGHTPVDFSSKEEAVKYCIPLDIHSFFEVESFFSPVPKNVYFINKKADGYDLKTVSWDDALAFGHGCMCNQCRDS